MARTEDGTRRILKNSGFLIGARSLTKLSTAAVYIYAARALGDAEFGVFSSVVAFVALFSLLEEWGLTVPMIRRIATARDRIGVEVGLQLSIKGGLGILAVGLLLAAASLSGIPMHVAMLFGVSMFFENLALTMVRSFEGVERMNVSASIIVAERVLFFVLGISVLATGRGLVGLAAAHAIANAGQSAIAYVTFRRKSGTVRMVTDIRLSRERLREASPFLVAAVLSVIYNRVDIFLLNSFRPSAELGWYAASYRLIDAQQFIPVAIVASLFPVLSRTGADQRQMYEYYFRRAFLLIAALGIGSGLVVGVLAAPLVRLLYGPAYAASAGQLQLLAWLVPVMFGNVLLGNGLIALSREKFSVLTIGIGAMLNVILGLVLIPWKGGEGAALARVFTEYGCFAVQAFFLARVYGAARILVPGLPTAHDGIPSEAREYR